MAIMTPTTHTAALEAPFGMLNPFALRFIDLLNAVNEHIWAECALDRADTADPNYPTRLKQANDASLLVYDLLAELTGRSVTAAREVPLRRMALVIATLFREGTSSAFRRYAEHRNDFSQFLAVPGNGPIESRIRHMLAAADKRISRMALLTLYRQDGVDHHAKVEAVTLAA
ncbi:hypothetical protein MLD63_16350 [Paracoccus sp. TK19116]|uniref:Uncharacterized protein n=1 Tax=Paracoccus albicereus TaxID=2922394 RepID=A0ABT1MUJ7_9RHOB|nr:hypothetical protein [Paracoccus albicereus]MCQ0971995.1 hypothetical protein [Paracoccus albicereus]